MSSSKAEGKKEEAGPAAAATAAATRWDDDTDQWGEKSQPYIKYLGRYWKSFWGQDGPGGIVVKGK